MGWAFQTVVVSLLAWYVSGERGRGCKDSHAALAPDRFGSLLEVEANSTDAFRGVGMTPRTPAIEVVVAARAKDDLRWIDLLLGTVRPAPKLALYCRGNEAMDKRCVHVESSMTDQMVYAFHISHNYEKLSPVTVFAGGDILSPASNAFQCRKLNFVLSQVNTSEKQAAFHGYATMANFEPGTFFSFNPNYDIQGSLSYEMKQSCKPSMGPLGKWYSIFVERNLSSAMTSGSSAQAFFAVAGDAVRRFPRSIYMKILKELEQCPEESRYLERSWKAMFVGDRARDAGRHGENACPEELRRLMDPDLLDPDQASEEETIHEMYVAIGFLAPLAVMFFASAFASASSNQKKALPALVQDQRKRAVKGLRPEPREALCKAPRF